MSTRDSAQEALYAHHLRVRFGGIEALGGVSVRCLPAQVVGVIGPNGAGKSTLFNAICGLSPVTSGHVVAGGQRLGAQRLRARDVLCILFFGLVATLGTSNLDALWRQCVVEPYRVEVMAARRHEPPREPVSLARTLWRGLLGAPFVRAERDAFCVMDAAGAPIGCDEHVQAAFQRLQTHDAQTSADKHRRLVRLVARWGVCLAVIGIFYRRRQLRRGWSPHALARAGVARTFQNIRLFDALSARDNVRVVWETTHASQRPQTNVDALLARVGLTAQAEVRASDLSYGQRRRLEIARALALSPRVLLLDEPAAGLHAGETSELLSLVRALRDEGMAILLIEHDMRLVMGVSDHLIVLDHGLCIAQGPPDEVRRNPDVIAAYLGEAPPDASTEAPC